MENFFLSCTIPFMAKKKQKKICDVCGGTGQINFFKGVSRFLLSAEECSECAGTGLQLDSVDVQSENCADAEIKKKKNDKKA